VATSVRTLFKFLLGLFAALQAAATPSRADHARPEAPSRSNASAMSAFMARLFHDADLRARFSQNPRAVLSQHGIDSGPYNLPERMTEAELQRLLSDRIRRLAEAAPNPPAPETGQPKPPPAPVYGPPPGVRPVPPKANPPIVPSPPLKPPSATLPKPDSASPPPPPSPSAPVYGPPPGLQPKP